MPVHVTGIFFILITESVKQFLEHRDMLIKK